MIALAPCNWAMVEIFGSSLELVIVAMGAMWLFPLGRQLERHKKGAVLLSRPMGSSDHFADGGDGGHVMFTEALLWERVF